MSLFSRLGLTVAAAGALAASLAIPDKHASARTWLIPFCLIVGIGIWLPLVAELPLYRSLRSTGQFLAKKWNHMVQASKAWLRATYCELVLRLMGPVRSEFQKYEMILRFIAPAEDEFQKRYASRIKPLRARPMLLPGGGLAQRSLEITDWLSKDWDRWSYGKSGPSDKMDNLKVTKDHGFTITASGDVPGGAFASISHTVQERSFVVTRFYMAYECKLPEFCELLLVLGNSKKRVDLKTATSPVDLTIPESDGIQQVDIFLRFKTQYTPQDYFGPVELQVKIADIQMTLRGSEKGS